VKYLTRLVKDSDHGGRRSGTLKRNDKKSNKVYCCHTVPHFCTNERLFLLLMMITNPKYGNNDGDGVFWGLGLMVRTRLFTVIIVLTMRISYEISSLLDNNKVY